MGDKTGIQWTEASWNPVRGCSVVSPGCVNCYAMKQAHRFSGTGKPYDGLTKMTSAGPQWTGEVRIIHEMLPQPIRWQRRRRIFVNSMSDLFHESLSDDDIDDVFGVMWACLYGRGGAPGHVFQVLTKRPERMRDYLSQDRRRSWAYAAVRHGGGKDPDALFDQVDLFNGPHPRIWLGVSAEDQKRWGERVPILLDTPAAVRWVSAEPLLGPIDTSELLAVPNVDDPLLREDPLAAYLLAEAMADGRASGRRAVDWIVVGGESGPGSRPCQVGWIADIVAQCASAEVACFVKQMGANTSLPGDPRPVAWVHKKGGDPAEWPPELRVRQYPEVSP